MTKKAFVLFMCLFFISFIVGCKDVDNAPPLTIECDSQNIPYNIGLNEWNGSKYDREDVLVSLSKDNNQIPYFELGKRIYISFEPEKAPDKIVLYDYILKEDGRPKYTDKETSEVTFEFINNEATFILNENLSAMLSSNSKDYEKGAVLRGFKLVCNWGKNECEYGFLIKTDAMKDKK